MIGKDDKLILIDADFLLYFCTYSKEKELEFEEVQIAAKEFLRSIFQITKATHYIGFFTSPNNFRYKIYPEYKANRKGRQPVKWLKELKLWLIENYNFYTHDGLEADDCVNIYRNKYQGAIIVSNDKDVTSLGGTIYNPTKHIWITADNVDLYFWKSMITGDKTDNIKGIPSKGLSYANNLLDTERGVPMSTLVLNEYIDHYKEYSGVREFYKNYMCLKILDNFQSEAEQFFEPKLIDNDFKQSETVIEPQF